MLNLPRKNVGQNHEDYEPQETTRNHKATPQQRSVEGKMPITINRIIQK